MRYLGQKKKLLEDIERLLQDKNIISNDMIFCDAFSGTASVGMHFRDKYKNIISNDNLYCAYTMAQAKLNIKDEKFEKLNFDPFEHLNSVDTDDFDTGFIYNTYAPTAGRRMFFSDENAKKIDFIRTTIEEWSNNGFINHQEKCYLIACLLESVSFVSNVAGMYGSYLKHWDPRAVKKMEFKRIEHVEDFSVLADIYNEDTLSFIKQVSGDVLYLDPPYTKTTYTGQYHLLETIAKYDNPSVHGKGALRDMSEYSTSFSKPNEAEIALEKLIKNANFKHVVMSYSCDGIISTDFIEALFKRYGIPETYELRRINYRRYKNAVAADNDKHQEYLFYVELKDKDKVTYSSPLNYTGGKYDMVYWLKEHMPKDIDTFYDLFGGGMNVSVNADANNVVYNDINFKVRELLEHLTASDTKWLLQDITRKISKYKLAKCNYEAYYVLRDVYNSKPANRRNLTELFLLIMYGFQQQIRFNSNYEFNNPAGNSSFNEKVKEKLVSFVSVAKEKNIVYVSRDYETFLDEIKEDDFVYLDPPYLITLGSYNDGKRGFNGWNEREEERLLAFIDKLDKKKVRFMLSNVLEHKEKENTILKDWVARKGFHITKYDGKARGNRKEIIITNY